MARRWRIQNYNAFLREAKRAWTLDHRQAQQLYRDLGRHLGYSLGAVDLRRHPRLVKRYAATARLYWPAREIPAPRITSVRDWLDWYEDWWDDEAETTYEGTAEYEEG